MTTLNLEYIGGNSNLIKGKRYILVGYDNGDLKIDNYLIVADDLLYC